MSYNGSGTFNINTAGQPVVTGTVISSSVFNALTADLATGLSTAITKDGQTTVTNNIPFNGYKITNLGAGTASTDAVRLGQLQAGTATAITVTGTDTYTGTMSPALASYTAGNTFSFVVPNTNTTGCTLNIDGQGAKAITRDGSTALIAGDLVAGSEVVVIYDGTRFQVLNSNSKTNWTVSNALTLSGGTANGVAYLNGSKALTTGSALTFDGTTLKAGAGGTGSATAQLTLDGGSAANGGGYIRFNRNGSTATYIGNDSAINGGTSDDFDIYASSNIRFYALNTEGMRLTSTGLGIGTSSPATKLEVSGSAVIARITGTSASVPQLQIVSGGVVNWSLRSNNDGGSDFTIYQDSTQRLKIDSSGNVGIGTSSPAWSLDVSSNGRIRQVAATGTNSALYQASNTGGGFYTGLENSTGSLFTGTAYAGVVWHTGNYPIAFGTNNTERARIDSSGNLMVGTTSVFNSSIATFTSQANNTVAAVQGTTGGYCFISSALTNGGTFYHASFTENGTQRGSITSNGSLTAYNTLSDYRLKDKQQALTGSGAFIDALKPKTWEWKADGSKGVGFIAHEVAEVSPASVVGEKDAVDADGKPVYQAMEYGSAEFIANIVAELQSLRARVAQLESK